MKVWFTAAEFAELAAQGVLPGLPATKRGMNALAAREGWERHAGLARIRQGRKGGGGLEYHLDLLPLSTRIAWASRHVTVAPQDVRPATAEADGLTARARTSRDARLVLVAMADRFRRDNSLPVAAADRLFANLYNGASIDVPAWVRPAAGSASARSLARWRAAGGRLGHDRAEARKGTGALDRALDGQVRTFVLAAIAKQPFLASDTLRAMVADKFGDAFAPLRTFQATLKRWRDDYRNELMLLTDPDAYRSKIEFAATGATRAERLNQLWQIDASPADVMLKEGRHSIYLAIDVLARRTKILATPTPRAAGVGLLMRKAIMAWGVPETVKTDNGSDFTAASTSRLLAALGIEVELSPPYQPKSKGMVERAIGTFQRDLAALPGFVGHSVADRKRLENRKAFAQRAGADERELFGVDMDLSEFQRWCDDWTDCIYATTPHQGLGGRTPLEAEAAYAGKVRRLDNAAALDVLLAPVPGKDGLRTVTKTGIRIGGAHYLTGSVMPGETVFCRMDPADLGRVWLFEPDGETFLGEAVAPELAGLDPVETIARVKAMQKAFVDARVKPIRAEMRKIGPRQAADAMRRAAATRAGTVVAFPRPAEAVSTPALDAAGRARRPAEPARLTGRAAEIHEQLVREAITPTPALRADPPLKGEGEVVRLPETAEGRFRRAVELEKRIAGGGDVAPRDRAWLGGFQDTSEYRALRQMVEEFGPEAMRLQK